VPEPKPTDFGRDEEGIVKFIQAHDQWAQDHPEEAAAAVAARAAAEGIVPPEGQAPEPVKVEEPAPPAEAPPATEKLPEAFDAVVQKDPALKAALEANPEAQKLVMEAARTSAAAAPVLAIVPTVEAAQFMAGHANTALDIRHNMLMGIENPAAAEAGFNGLVSQFIETDDKGIAMKDAAGKPVYGKDLDIGLLTPGTKMKLGGMLEQTLQQIKDLETKTKGVYPTQAAKDADLAALDDANYTRDAFNYVMSLLSPAEDGGLPALPPDATPEQKATQERLERQMAEFRAEREAAGKGAQAKDIQTFENTLRLDWQREVGKGLDDHLAAMKARGEYIPDYIVTRKWVDPTSKQETSFPSLAVEILNEFDSRVMGIPTERAELQRLQRLGRPGEQQRKANAARLRVTYLGPIIQRHVTEIQNGLRESQAAEEARRSAAGTVARVEPTTTGAGGAPAALTDAQIEEKATAMVKADPRWAAADQEERAAIMMTARTRVKYGY
jgi:hypothetical protein